MESIPIWFSNILAFCLGFTVTSVTIVISCVINALWRAGHEK